MFECVDRLGWESTDTIDEVACDWDETGCGVFEANQKRLGGRCESAARRNARHGSQLT